ncbi:MAG: hypothetical protein LBC96_07270 [Lachnospiraceae bacterium]|jgi:hypothetical protein|nr:hypothetical protein [Lachnospiraceae bacterium]
MKINFVGIEAIIYPKNLYNDNLPLAKVGGRNITTREVKTHLDNLIQYIDKTVEACAIFDERYERFSTALGFLVSIKGFFRAKTPQHVTEEVGKITIDVIKEIALMSEPLDENQKRAIKSAAFIAKLTIEKVCEI